MKPDIKQIDARLLQPKEKHPTIFNTFKSLKSGEVMHLINDHDPIPLFHNFNTEFKDGFSWEYLEKGPDIWRVEIGKK